MSSRPEAIDSRLVLHVYSAAALPLGIISYSWPLIVPGAFPALDSNVRLRLAAAVLTALGTCGAALAQIDDPIGRRRGLIGFAHAHLMLGRDAVDSGAHGLGLSAGRGVGVDARSSSVSSFFTWQSPGLARI